jgi:outer membrane protein assembly factor BamB
VANGVVYVGSNDGKVYGLDASTGAFLWSYATGNIVESSPAVANGVVYVGSFDAKIYAFDLAGGTSTTGRPTPSQLRPDRSLGLSKDRSSS